MQDLYTYFLDKSQSSSSVSITVISVVTALLVLGILLATVIAIICQRKRKESTYNPNHIYDLPDYSQFEHKRVNVEPDVKQQGVEGNSGADCEMETNIAYGLSRSNQRDNAEESAEMVPQ